MENRCTGRKTTVSVDSSFLSNNRSVSSLGFDIGTIFLVETGRHATFTEDKNLALAPGRLGMLGSKDVEDQEGRQKAEKDTNIPNRS
ncbi:unnamed protein product [Fusarium graminearum]|nr:unnamed protein product [Fusarium graminearum]